VAAVDASGDTAWVTDPSLDGLHAVTVADGAFGGEVKLAGTPVALVTDRGWPTSTSW
jgi:hypothetical protein